MGKLGNLYTALRQNDVVRCEQWNLTRKSPVIRAYDGSPYRMKSRHRASFSLAKWTVYGFERFRRKTSKRRRGDAKPFHFKVVRMREGLCVLYL
ncbi:hypothetical protein ACE6H2_016780 [Prunus campanulata]